MLGCWSFETRWVGENLHQLTQSWGFCTNHMFWTWTYSFAHFLNRLTYQTHGPCLPHDHSFTDKIYRCFPHDENYWNGVWRMVDSRAADWLVQKVCWKMHLVCMENQWESNMCWYLFSYTESSPFFKFTLFYCTYKPCDFYSLKIQFNFNFIPYFYYLTSFTLLSWLP